LKKGETMDHYEKLRLLLDAHPSGAPKSEKFDEIIRTLQSGGGGRGRGDGLLPAAGGNDCRRLWNPC
jgi:hypothetical protein